MTEKQCAIAVLDYERLHKDTRRALLLQKEWRQLFIAIQAITIIITKMWKSYWYLQKDQMALIADFISAIIVVVLFVVAIKN